MLDFENDKSKIFLVGGIVVLSLVYFFYPQDEYHPKAIKVVQPHIENANSNNNRNFPESRIKG